MFPAFYCQTFRAGLSLKIRSFTSFPDTFLTLSRQQDLAETSSWARFPASSLTSFPLFFPQDFVVESIWDMLSSSNDSARCLAASLVADFATASNQVSQPTTLLKPDWKPQPPTVSPESCALNGVQADIAASGNASSRGSSSQPKSQKIPRVYISKKVVFCATLSHGFGLPASLRLFPILSARE